MALTLEQRITKAHISIFNNPNFAFLACVVMMGKSVVSEQYSTAATDGRNKFYNREFCSKLSEPELRFVILHENYHAAARHMTTYQDLFRIDPELANEAADHWINLSLIEADNKTGFIEMPSIGGCADPKYAGWAVPQIFADLRKQKQDGKGSSGNSFDEHLWEEADKMSPQEQKQLAADIDQALRQGKILSDKLSGKMPRQIGDLLKVEVDWREQLPDFVKDCSLGHEDADWSKLDRKLFGAGHYYPALMSLNTGPILFCNDTSGSISMDLLTLFASHLVTVCKELSPERVDVLWWDTEVASVQSFEKDEFDGIDTKLIPAGGGGTNPDCIRKWYDEHEKKDHMAVIILTDGYVASWPTFDIPTLWAITTDVVAPTGKTIHIKEM